MCKRNPNCVHALPEYLAAPNVVTARTSERPAAYMRYPCVLRYRSPQLRLTPLYNPDPPSKSPSSEGDFCRAPCALRVEPAGKRRIPEWSVERAYVTRVSCGTECRSYGLRRCTIPTPPQPLPREGLLSRALRAPGGAGKANAGCTSAIPA
ncbi:hypothetical protein IMSAGC022_00594 [Alistipes sp.]|nr:hypothetical protein IMSAGC022_00594 [Alistipes sp.]